MKYYSQSEALIELLEFSDQEGWALCTWQIDKLLTMLDYQGAINRVEALEKALGDLRQAQKNYIAWTRQAQHEPDYAEERERLGKLVGEAADVADKVLSREVKEVNDGM